MTKRLHFTLEEVLEDVLSDDEDLDDEPMMEGSDDEFSDLEVEEDEDDIDSAIDTIGAQGLTARKYNYTLIIHKILEKYATNDTLFYPSTPESRPSHFSRALSLAALESRPSHFSRPLSLTALESRSSHFFLLSNYYSQLSPW